MVGSTRPTARTELMSLFCALGEREGKNRRSRIISQVIAIAFWLHSVRPLGHRLAAKLPTIMRWDSCGIDDGHLQEVCPFVEYCQRSMPAITRRICSSCCVRQKSKVVLGISDQQQIPYDRIYIYLAAAAAWKCLRKTKDERHSWAKLSVLPSFYLCFFRATSFASHSLVLILDFRSSCPENYTEKQRVRDND